MTQRKYISVDAISVSFGVPAAWLRREVKAGRIPCLRAGRRLLFNPTLVEQALDERARLAGRLAVDVGTQEASA